MPDAASFYRCVPDKFIPGEICRRCLYGHLYYPISGLSIREQIFLWNILYCTVTDIKCTGKASNRRQSERIPVVMELKRLGHRSPEHELSISLNPLPRHLATCPTLILALGSDDRVSAMGSYHAWRRRRLAGRGAFLSPLPCSCSLSKSSAVSRLSDEVQRS